MSREVTPGNGPPNLHAMMGMGYPELSPMQMNGGAPLNGNVYGNSARKTEYVDSGVGE